MADGTGTAPPARRPRAAAFGAVGPVSLGAAAVVALGVLLALLAADPALTPSGDGPRGAVTGGSVPGETGADVGADVRTAHGLRALAGGWLAGVGVLLAVTDARTHRLPDKLLLGAAGVAGPLLVVAALVGGEPEALLHAAAGGLVPAGVLYVVALVTPGGVGLGDVKLLLVTGAWLGYLSITAAALGPALGIVIGALVSIAAVAMRRATLRSHVPLGPALVLGAALATWLDVAGLLAV